jgi:flavin reductase (DIM6/NTAB) family NADH-FMN oxidoreductase RutF
MVFNPDNLNQRELHNLMMRVIVPRPIAWVSTVSKQGIYNLAPFSGYCMIGDRPAAVGIGIIATRDGGKKDTLRNIEDTNEFVVNVVNETLGEAMNITSAPFPGDISEFKEAKLTPGKAELVKAPLVVESPINLECLLSQVLEYGEGARKAWFVIGTVLRVHVKDDLISDGVIQMSRLKAIGRLGGNDYCRTQDAFEMKRPA